MYSSFSFCSFVAFSIRVLCCSTNSFRRSSSPAIFSSDFLIFASCSSRNFCLVDNTSSLRSRLSSRLTRRRSASLTSLRASEVSFSNDSRRLASSLRASSSICFCKVVASFLPCWTTCSASRRAALSVWMPINRPSTNANPAPTTKHTSVRTTANPVDISARNGINMASPLCCSVVGTRTCAAQDARGTAR